MNIERPPYGTSVENIQRLCESTRDAKVRPKEELEDEIGDMDEISFQRTLEAAVTFGLFEHVEDEGYRSTTTGRRLGYGELSEAEREEFFRELLVNYDFYYELLQLVTDRTSTTEDGEEKYISRDTVQSEMGINFDLGMGDRILKSAAGTFLRFLDQCGLGHYARSSSSGLPTRLVLNDAFEEFTGTAGATASVEQSSAAVDEDETHRQPEVQKQDAEALSIAAVGPEGEGHAVLQALTEQDSIEVTVSIDISAGELSTDELLELVEMIQNGS